MGSDSDMAQIWKHWRKLDRVAFLFALSFCLFWLAMMIAYPVQYILGSTGLMMILTILVPLIIALVADLRKEVVVVEKS